MTLGKCQEILLEIKLYKCCQGLSQALKILRE